MVPRLLSLSVAFKCSFCRAGKRQAQEILKQDSAVARFIRMFPAGAALVPIFKRFFEVKLNGVDQLVLAAFDHHLILAKV